METCLYWPAPIIKQIIVNYCSNWKKSVCREAVFHQGLIYQASVCLPYCPSQPVGWIQLEMSHPLNMHTRAVGLDAFLFDLKSKLFFFFLLRIAFYKFVHPLCLFLWKPRHGYQSAAFPVGNGKLVWLVFLVSLYIITFMFSSCRHCDRLRVII